jgi:putative oxidoreductase
MTSLVRYFPGISRVLLSVTFIATGFGKMAYWRGAEDYMATKNLPAIPLLLLLATLIECGGGIALFLGWKARYSALTLFVYLIPVTILFHDFWALQGMQAQIEMISFMKNIAIMGGLGLVIAFGPGPHSVDSWRRRKAAPRR